MQKRTFWSFGILFFIFSCSIWGEDIPFRQKQSYKNKLTPPAPEQILDDFINSFDKSKQLDKKINDLIQRLAEAKQKIEPELSFRNAYIKQEINALSEDLHTTIEEQNKINKHFFERKKYILDNFSMFINKVNSSIKTIQNNLQTLEKKGSKSTPSQIKRRNDLNNKLLIYRNYQFFLNKIKDLEAENEKPESKESPYLRITKEEGVSESEVSPPPPIEESIKSGTHLPKMQMLRKRINRLEREQLFLSHKINSNLKEIEEMQKMLDELEKNLKEPSTNQTTDTYTPIPQFPKRLPPPRK